MEDTKDTFTQEEFQRLEAMVSNAEYQREPEYIFGEIVEYATMAKEKNTPPSYQRNMARGIIAKAFRILRGDHIADDEQRKLWQRL